MSDRIVIKNDHLKDIQAYIDYTRIVGVDDGGVMMSEKEFEAYKDKVREARKNHLYVNWTNLKGQDCKAIGPESMCFCGHRYKMHNFDNVKTKKVNCKDKKCKCALFNYIPVHGSNDIKCLCKHSYSMHDNLTRRCEKENCKCFGFGSKFTCNCTYSYDEHSTTIETREERQSQGKTVDPSWMGQNFTAGIGGLNSFSGIGMQQHEGFNEYDKVLENNEDTFYLNEKQKIYGNSDNNTDLVKFDKKQSGNTLSSYTNSGMSTNMSNSNTDENLALSLFLTPHKYSGGKSVKKMLSGNVNMQVINSKMNNLNFK